MTAWLVADTEDMSTNAALRAKCYWPNIQTLNNTPKPAKLVNRTTGTSGKYANVICSNLSSENLTQKAVTAIQGRMCLKSTSLKTDQHFPCFILLLQKSKCQEIVTHLQNAF